MWVYDSPIGPLYIVRTDDGQYGFFVRRHYLGSLSNSAD